MDLHVLVVSKADYQQSIVFLIIWWTFHVMPPKSKNKPKIPEQNIPSTGQDDVLNQEFEKTEGESNMASPAKWRESLEDLIDRRPRQQSDQLTELMQKHWKLYKQEVDEVKQSQDYISAKFDKVIVSIEELKQENKKLREETEEAMTTSWQPGQV